MYLPTELQDLILGYVGGNDTFKVSTLCKLWFNLLNKKFNKDDFSDKAINDSFALKHLFDVHEQLVLKYANIKNIKTNNCLNLIAYKIIKNGYLDDHNRNLIFSEKYTEGSKLYDYSVSYFDIYTSKESVYLIYDILYQYIYNCDSHKQKHIIKLIKMIFEFKGHICMMDANFYQRQYSMLYECLQNKRYDFAYYLIISGFSLDGYFDRLIGGCNDKTYLSVIDQLKYFISKKLIIVPKFLIYLKTYKNLSHKNDIVKFLEENLSDEDKSLIYDYYQ